MKKSGAKDHKPAARGRKYIPPRIVEYGKVRELTTGGSGHANEKAQGQPAKKRP